MCDLTLAMLGVSLGFKAVMRGFRGSGWGLGIDRRQVGLLKRAYIKALSGLPSQHWRLWAGKR